MIRWLLLAALLLLAVPSRANQIVVLPGGCGTGTPVTGQEIVYVDTAGNQCGASGGAGGGGPATIADGADVAEGATADAAATAGSTGTVSAKLRLMTTQLNTILTAVQAATPAGTNVIGYTTPDPCSQVAKVSVAISQTGNTKVVSATSAKKNYLCSILTIGADAEALSLVEGTGSTCGTNTAAIIGATTAAAGPNFAANGGFTLGNGMGTVSAGITTNTDWCLFQSGSGRVAGVLTYVQQ